MKLKSVHIILAILLIALVILSLTLGSVKIPISDIFSPTKGQMIVLRLRLPRVIGAILAGGALGIAGELLQCATDNELTSPNIIGVNSGAGLCVIMVLCFFPTAFYILPIAAFIGAIISVAIVIMVSSVSGMHRSKSALILTGVAVSALFNAGISFLNQLYPDVTSGYISFTTGGFNGVYLKDIILPGIIIVVCTIYAYILTPKMDILSLGDDIAISLGVNPKKMRIKVLIISALLAACAVSYCGLLGFVGLLVPHIGRKLVGVQNRRLFPVTLTLGAILVLISDLIGRTLFAPSEIPAGIFLSFIGGPFFIFLMISKRRRRA